MSDPLERLKTALADRYAIEREIGSGGIPRQAVSRYDGKTVGMFHV
jgi:hypothetical protein